MTGAATFGRIWDSPILPVLLATITPPPGFATSATWLQPKPGAKADPSANKIISFLVIQILQLLAELQAAGVVWREHTDMAAKIIGPIPIVASSAAGIPLRLARYILPGVVL
jgi:hypothetical protein